VTSYSKCSREPTFWIFFLLPAAQAPSAKTRGQGTARVQGVRGGGAEDAVGGQAFGGICIFSKVLYSDFI
jgi:hypothetical protein